jgi:hypothetical protein
MSYFTLKKKLAPPLGMLLCTLYLQHISSILFSINKSSPIQPLQKNKNKAKMKRKKNAHIGREKKELKQIKIS